MSGSVRSDGGRLARCTFLRYLERQDLVPAILRLILDRNRWKVTIKVVFRDVRAPAEHGTLQ